jgi:hypothetical protein
MLVLAAPQAPARWRLHRIAIEPFNNAAGKRPGFGLRTGQPAVELGDAGPFIEEHLPVLA